MWRLSLVVALLSMAGTRPRKTIVDVVKMVGDLRVPKDAFIDTKNGYIEYKDKGHLHRIALWVRGSEYLLGITDEPGATSWYECDAKSCEEALIPEQLIPNVEVEALWRWDDLTDDEEKLVETLERDHVDAVVNYELPRTGTTLVAHVDLQQTFASHPKLMDVAKRRLNTRIEYDFNKGEGRAFKLGKISP